MSVSVRKAITSFNPAERHTSEHHAGGNEGEVVLVETALTCVKSFFHGACVRVFVRKRKKKREGQIEHTSIFHQFHGKVDSK
jgi:hypothetical protein